jgi:hypothetical protein
VTSDQIKARRLAREIVQDLRWQGGTMPPLYTRMAREFQELVASGDYAAWVASGPRTAAPRDRRVIVTPARRAPAPSRPATPDHRLTKVPVRQGRPGPDGGPVWRRV